MLWLASKTDDVENECKMNVDNENAYLKLEIVTNAKEKKYNEHRAGSEIICSELVLSL